MFAGDEVRSLGNSTHYNFILLYLLSKQWISILHLLYCTIFVDETW